MDAPDTRPDPDDFYTRLLGAIFPEAVRQAQVEKLLKRADAANWKTYTGFRVDLYYGEGYVQDLLTGIPAWSRTWRSRTPAEVEDYDRRFCHLLGIRWEDGV